jgi:hypothetical protein
MNLSTGRTSQDPLVKALLQTHKFNLLSVPRAGADVYDLYLGKGRNILPPGRLESLWRPKIALPDPKRGEPFKAPEKTYSAALTVSVVTKLTGKLFAAQGSTLLDSKMDASLKSAGASSAQIRFYDVVRDSVDPIKVHKAIVGNQLGAASLELLKGRRAYLVVGVVRAKGIEIKVAYEQHKDAQANLTVGEIAQGKTDIVIENKGSGNLVFKGKQWIAFGVELVELQLKTATKKLHIGDLPPALDIRAGITVPPALIGRPDGALFVDLPAPKRRSAKS